MQTTLGAREARAADISTHERARFYLDGVERAIVANVARRETHGLVIEQPLPFLRLDTPVRNESGEWSRISRVGLSLEGGVPRIVLELSDRPSDAPPSAAAVVTPTEDTDRHFTPGVSVRRARTDSTVPYDFEPERLAEAIVVAPKLPSLPAPAPARRSLFARAMDWIASLFAPRPRALARG